MVNRIKSYVPINFLTMDFGIFLEFVSYFLSIILLSLFCHLCYTVTNQKLTWTGIYVHLNGTKTRRKYLCCHINRQSDRFWLEDLPMTCINRIEIHFDAHQAKSTELNSYGLKSLSFIWYIYTENWMKSAKFAEKMGKCDVACK